MLPAALSIMCSPLPSRFCAISYHLSVISHHLSAISRHLRTTDVDYTVSITTGTKIDCFILISDVDLTKLDYFLFFDVNYRLLHYFGWCRWRILDLNFVFERRLLLAYRFENIKNYSLVLLMKKFIKKSSNTKVLCEFWFYFKFTRNESVFFKISILIKPSAVFFASVDR